MQHMRADYKNKIGSSETGKWKYKTYLFHASVSNVFLDISIAEYNHGDIIRPRPSEWLFLGLYRNLFFIYLFILKFDLSVPEPLLVEINLPAPLSLIP